MKRWAGPWLLAVLTAVACSSGEQLDLAEAHVKLFHQRLSNREFHSIDDLAADEFRKSARKEDILRFLAMIHSKLGRVEQSNKLNWNVNYTLSGTFVTLNYETQYAHGNANEQFVFRVAKPDASLIRYRIDSADLIAQ